MVYLRHHGFPSPLLDWTESPYVAAFFAFHTVTNEQIDKKENVKIYTYQAYKRRGAKAILLSKPHIKDIGPNLKAHKRHYIQQCRYTYCMKEENEKNKYCRYEDVTQNTGGDTIQEYVLPCSLRNEFLGKLNQMNINAFTLFENEEGLMSLMAQSLRQEKKL